MIILKMMNSNNTPSELRVILNRGNHEDVSIYMDHGFNAEMKAKMSKDDYKFFRFYIFHFFTYLSSAIFLKNDPHLARLLITCCDVAEHTRRCVNSLSNCIYCCSFKII